MVHSAKKEVWVLRNGSLVHWNNQQTNQPIDRDRINSCVTQTHCFVISIRFILIQKKKNRGNTSYHVNVFVGMNNNRRKKMTMRVTESMITTLSY